MLDFSWKVFSMTGSIDTYLLIKQMERDDDVDEDTMTEGDVPHLDAPSS